MKRSPSKHKTETHQAQSNPYLAKDEPWENSTTGFQQDSDALKHLLKFAAPRRKAFFWSLLCLLATSALAITSSLLLGRVVEQGLGARNEVLAYQLIALVIAIELIMVALSWIGRRGMAQASSETLLDIREHLYARLQLLPVSYFDHQPLGRTVTRLTHDVEGLEDFFAGTLGRMVSIIFTVFIALGAMLLADYRFGLLACAALVPAFVATFLFRNPMRYWNREFSKQNSALNARMSEYLNGLPVIRAFGAEHWSKVEFDSGIREYLNAALNTNWWNAVSRPIIQFLCFLPTLCLLGFGGYQTLQGALSLGMFVAFLRYSERFSRPLSVLINEIHVIQAAFTSLERIRRYLTEPTEHQTLVQTNNLTLTDPKGNIEFRNVGMKYDSGKPALKNVSFQIPAGTKVGLAGATGSGKTTTVSLLARLYEFQHGEILLENIPIRDYNRNSLRQSLGYVSQDVVIFRGSLRDNLTGGLSKKDAEILQACKQTGFLRLMEKSNLDLNSEILEQGANLSIGEKQLVALTRVLLKDPAILILDEATANVDPVTEQVITQAVSKVMTGRTCLIIAHRLETLKSCDRILVFKDGELVEQGSGVEDLNKRSGYFAQLWEKSSSN